MRSWTMKEKGPGIKFAEPCGDHLSSNGTYGALIDFVGLSLVGMSLRLSRAPRDGSAPRAGPTGS